MLPSGSGSRNFPTRRPNGCIVSNGLASMGIALPGGVAAGLVDPGRPVIAAMVGGGFLMNSQELETANRLGVPFTCIVSNDNDCDLISWKQQQSRGQSVSTRIGNQDFTASVIVISIDRGVTLELVKKLKQYWRS